MRDHEQAGEGLERALDDMQRASDRLGEDIDEARSDWRRKQEDANVPGAERPRDDEPESEDE
jgi:hypothetical protein